MADQDPELYEEFIVEEEEETQSNRPFIFALSGLVGILLLSLLCLGAYQIFFAGDGDGTPVADVSDDIAATATIISATNEAIETQNALVTQTLVAMELTAQAPTATFTPTPPPTNTPTPIPSATPTATEVVDPGTDDDGEDGNEDATPVFDDDGDQTGDGGSDETVGSADVSANTSGSAEELPETGLSIWAGVIAALGLLVLMVVARRLRAP